MDFSNTTTPRCKMIALLLLGALILTACDLSFSVGGDDIEGSGQLTAQTYNVADFTEIQIGADLDVVVEFVDGDDPTLEIVTDDNLHSSLRVRTQGVTLAIDPKNNTNPKPTTPLVVRVTGHGVAKLSADSNASLRAMVPPRTTLSVSADSNGSVDVEVDVTKLILSADSNGDVKVSGRATQADIQADSNGSARFVGTDLVDGTVDADSDGFIEVVASGTVTGHADSNGTVRVLGDAAIDVSTDSDGEVRRG